MAVLERDGANDVRFHAVDTGGLHRGLGGTPFRWRGWYPHADTT